MENGLESLIEKCDSQYREDGVSQALYLLEEGNAYKIKNTIRTTSTGNQWTRRAEQIRLVKAQQQKLKGK